MADTPAINTKSLNVDRARITDLQVTRTRAGQIVNSSDDLIREVRDSIKEETKTLDRTLHAIHKVIQQDQQARKNTQSRGRHRGPSDFPPELQHLLGGATVSGRGRSRNTGAALLKAIENLNRSINAMARNAARGGGGGRGRPPGGVGGPPGTPPGTPGGPIPPTSGGRDSIIRALMRINLSIRNFHQDVVRNASGGRLPVASTPAGPMGGAAAGIPVAGGHRNRRYPRYLGPHDIDFARHPGGFLGAAKDTVVVTAINEQQRALTNFRDAISDITRKLISWANVTNDLKERFKSFFNILGGPGATAGSGVASSLEIILDDLVRLARGTIFSQDSFQYTLKRVRKSIEDGFMSPLASTGRDLTELGKAMNTARGGLRAQGYDYFRRMGVDETNDTLEDMYRFQKRMGLREDITSGSMLNRAAQLQSLTEIIAANTGKTVAEINKLSREIDKEISTQAAAGLLKGAQADNFRQTSRILQEMGGPGKSIQQLINRIVRAGSMERFMAENPEDAKAMVFSGTDQTIRRLYQRMIQGRRPGQGDAELNNEILDIASQIGNATARLQGQNTNVISTAISSGFQEIIANANELRDSGITKRKEEQARKTDPLNYYFNQIQEFFKTKIPQLGNLLMSTTGALIASNAALTAAVIMNTRAVAANTLRGGGGMPTAGAAGSAGGAGRLASGIGRTLVRGMPLVGGVAAGGLTALAGGGLMESIMTGVGGTAGAILGGLLGLPLGGVGAFATGAAGGAGGAMLGGQLGAWIDGMTRGDTKTASPDIAATGFGRTADETVKKTVQWQDETAHLMGAMLTELRAQSDMLGDMNKTTSKSRDALEDLRSRRQQLDQGRSMLSNFIPDWMTRSNSSGTNRNKAP